MPFVTKKTWPEDAVMIIAPLAGGTDYSLMRKPFNAKCRDCERAVVCCSLTQEMAEKHPDRGGRPVKYFCPACGANYERPEEFHDHGVKEIVPPMR